MTESCRWDPAEHSWLHSHPVTSTEITAEFKLILVDRASPSVLEQETKHSAMLHAPINSCQLSEHAMIFQSFTHALDFDQMHSHLNQTQQTVHSFSAQKHLNTVLGEDCAGQSCLQNTHARLSVLLSLDSDRGSLVHSDTPLPTSQHLNSFSLSDLDVAFCLHTARRQPGTTN